MTNDELTAIYVKMDDDYTAALGRPSGVAPLTVKQRRKAERQRLKLASLNEQLAWFGNVAERRAEGFEPQELRADVKRIQKAIAKLSTLAPSMTWYRDACGLRLDQGGAFPPTDEQGVPLMAKARGETYLYPPAYLTTSGHSFDTFIIAFMTGESPLLDEGDGRFRLSRNEVLYLKGRAELPADGYMGSIVRVNQLPESERRRFRRAEHGAVDGHRITNIL